MLRKLCKLLTIVPMVTILNVTPALAETWSLINAVPTNWRLENYPGGTGANGWALWYAGSPCFQGNFSLPSNATEGDRNRLYTLILLAKATSKPVGIWYVVDSAGNCVIRSFYMQ